MTLKNGLLLLSGLLFAHTSLSTMAAEEVLAFVGARLITGTGAQPIAEATLLVESGRITAVGPATAVSIPDQAIIHDVSGQTIIPGLINAHGHLSGVRGLESGHYTEQNLLRQLALYARYGVTTVNSLGDDGPEGFALRDRLQPDTLSHARMLLTGRVLAPDSIAQAQAEVAAAASLDPAFIKIRVDDNLGRTAKMPMAIAAEISRQAQAFNIPLAVHTYYLEDTAELLRQGADFVAHSVRDRHVDDNFIALIKSTNACYSPTLTREVSTFVYEGEPEFFSDPFFLQEVDPQVIAGLRDPARQQRLRQSESAQQYKASLAIAMTNLKILSDAGVRIAMGTDSGPVARFQGYFEHLEMAMMADAGMSPMAILQAATATAAECLGLTDTGTLVSGNWADFVVLDANPLEDIRNTRTISQVWIAGNRVPGR
ncbi:MAG: amidohydrolase family protein [Pseudomonadales bacterium]|nr:amidohydrolase family protein [Pseudomonadales bacterium]